MKPFVKWAGGKRQILGRIKEFINDSIADNENYTYIEPFLGGGAVFFDLMPRKAIISDLNADLINAYKVIQSDEIESLIALLDEHAKAYFDDPDGYYYEVRAWDREPGWPDNRTDVERAARMIFLNRTCYNGLYRVNLKGQFNTPIGRYKNPTICDRDNLREIHNYLSSKENDIQILSNSYEITLAKAKDGDVIYIDPPYDYEDDDGFTKYQMTGFTFDDFVALKKECDKTINKGAFDIISNNATQRVIDLFEQDPKYKIFYDVSKFSTLRSINCVGSERKTGKEVIFWGMNNNIPFPQANDMTKIIRLVMAEEEVLNDKDKAMELIQVSTVRQVAYYLSALLFLKYITHDKKFTDSAKSIKDCEIEVKKDIHAQLLKSEIFKEFYLMFFESKKVDVSIIKKSLLETKENRKLAESTLNRRASTIKAWVEWMYKFDEELKY